MALFVPELVIAGAIVAAAIVLLVAVGPFKNRFERPNPDSKTIVLTERGDAWLGRVAAAGSTPPDDLWHAFAGSRSAGRTRQDAPQLIERRIRAGLQRDASFVSRDYACRSVRDRSTGCVPSITTSARSRVGSRS